MLVFFLNSWSSIPLEWSSGEHTYCNEWIRWFSTSNYYSNIFFSTHTQTLHSFSKEFAFALILLSRFHVKLHFISFENDITLDFIFLHLIGKNVQNWPLYLQQFFQKFLKILPKHIVYVSILMQVLRYFFLKIFSFAIVWL